MLLMEDNPIMDIEEELDLDAASSDLSAFKEALLSSILDRFTKDKKKNEFVFDTDGKQRHIVTTNIFDCDPIILATVLDPRIKFFPFKGKACICKRAHIHHFLNNLTIFVCRYKHWIQGL